MNHEDRLKQILDSSAADPGPKQDWDEFVHTARRDRMVHRIVLAGTAAVFVLLIVFATVALGGLFGDTTPKPAEEDKQEREIEKDDKKEDREQERDGTEGPERKKKSKDSRIVPGPGKVPGTDGDGKSGERKDAGGDTERKGASDGSRTETRDASCDGRKATVVGTPGSDQLNGTSGADVIAGLGGKDTIRANGGDDLICGDFGDDTLMGGPGDDRFEGGAGFDFVSFPTAAADINVNLEQRFIQGDGNDRVTGVEGAVGTAFNDNLSGNSAANVLIGGGGSDAMNGFDGDDIFVPGPGDDAMAGHAGRDTVRFGSGGSGIQIDLAAHDGPGDDVTATGEGTDSVHFIENVRGTIHDDVISGNPKPNTFLGMGGNDTLSGREGADFLSGGGGRDELDGGPGNDTCSGGETVRGCEQRG